MENRLNPLQSISSSLHLLYHRNKNQHRQSKWWKWLAILRRSVVKLSQELRSLQRERCIARIIHFRDVLVPKCYGPFTQLIRDPQFAALGVVLVAELSKVKRAMDVFMENDATIKDKPAIKERDGSQLVDCSFGPSEDIGETVLRAGQLSDTANFEASQSNSLKSKSRRSSYELVDIEPADGLVFASTRPQPSESTLEKADDEEPTLLSYASGRGQDNVNAIDRLFSGLI